MIVTWPAGDQFCVHTLIVNPAAWPGLMLPEVRVTAMQICGVAFTTASRVAVGLDVAAWVVGVVVAECELDADALGDGVWVADGVVWVADGDGDGELDGEGLGDGLGVGLGLGGGVGCLDGVGDGCGAGLPGTDPRDSHCRLVSRLGRT